jgi:hypothetical protein
MQPTELLLEKIPYLKKVKGLSHLNKITSCDLAIQAESKYASFSDADKVLQELENFKPEQGWLCFQNKVKFFRKGDKIPTDSTILLYGEVVNADGISLHIREDGQGGWILTYFTETDGNNYLVENQSFLGESKLAPEQLYYRVYWQHDDKQGYRQVAARFTGFEDK